MTEPTGNTAALHEPDAADVRRRLVDPLPVTERQLSVAGVETALLEGGEGPPVVLLHGPGESAVWWLRVIPDLVTTHRVVAPDLPGHGASGVPDGRLDRAGTLRWVRALISRTCQEPPALVGHMLGGAVAALFAVADADRLRSLVLVDSFGLAPFRPRLAFAVALLRFQIRPTERSHEGLHRHCWVDLDGVRDGLGDRWEPFVAYYLDQARNPTSRTALRQLLLSVGFRAIPEEDLASITVPTTLIWGRHDPVVRLHVAEAVAARCGWPLHVIQEAGDDLAVEQPAAFLEALRNALHDE